MEVNMAVYVIMFVKTGRKQTVNVIEKLSKNKLIKWPKSWLLAKVIILDCWKVIISRKWLYRRFRKGKWLLGFARIESVKTYEEEIIEKANLACSRENTTRSKNAQK